MWKRIMGQVKVGGSNPLTSTIIHIFSVFLKFMVLKVPVLKLRLTESTFKMSLENLWHIFVNEGKVYMTFAPSTWIDYCRWAMKNFNFKNFHLKVHSDPDNIIAVFIKSCRVKVHNQRGILEALSSNSGVKYFTSTLYFASKNVRALLCK